MQSTSWTPRPALSGSTHDEPGIALVHILLKEIEWIRKLSGRLCRTGAERERARRDLESIRELSSSVAHAMRRYLDEARQAEAPTAAGVEVEALVSEAVARVDRRSPTPIRVRVDESARGAVVSGQVMIALVAVLENAIDFGRPQPVRVRVRDHGGVVAIAIEDRGPGMASPVASACRDRGFTTRAEGEGHGFGLYTASRILEQNQGALSVESAPGRGTRVMLMLPCLRRACAEPIPIDSVA